MCWVLCGGRESSGSAEMLQGAVFDWTAVWAALKGHVRAPRPKVTEEEFVHHEEACIRIYPSFSGNLINDCVTTRHGLLLAD